MLRLKRASAGSGKTYELAKTFIKMLLTYKRENDPRRLRNEATVHEALKGIMAVTFTVKATAEMKMRIVEKLADLALADIKKGKELEDIDYLEEFEKDLRPATRFDIARLARKALSALLLHYSDFKVQTIDSFFQSILHTFAYEASLDDNFNMEIDTDYVASVGLDSALDELSESNLKTGDGIDTLHWLKQVMAGNLGSRKWNVFTRQDGEKYLYYQLIKQASNLEKEDFQQIREELRKYFANLEKPFAEIIREVEEANLAEWEVLHRKRYRAASELMKLLERNGLSHTDLCKSQGSKLILSLQEFDKTNFNLPKTKVSVGSAAHGYSLKGGADKKLKEYARTHPEVNDTAIYEIDAAYLEWQESVNDFMDKFEEEKATLLTWKEYARMLPRFMLVMEIARRKEAYLQSTNSLQISDTNHILKEIIGDEETPFVYERMGSRLNHYLIDEFQDTSRMQWENLFPLLKESDSGGHDNLIIGDAKQSIYRFRNADYRLIMEVGEMEGTSGFSEIVPYTTEKEPEDKSKENTNFRSKPRVVELNNFIFSNIVDLKQTNGEREGENIFNQTIRGIYKDCVQAIPKGRLKEGEPQGYVEINLYNPPKKEKWSESEKFGKIDLSEPGFKELPGKIMELRERGYRFRDIGILVKTHEVGQAAMKAISLFNANNPENQIPVISEENLLVASAFSVKLIIHALEMTLEGSRVGNKKNSPIGEPVDEEALFEMLRSMQSLALPSLVEAIAERFIPEETRKSENSFIAAFQDAVLDYTQSHTSDVGSFLKWWKQKAKKLSITSPEDSDGVRLNTIHQSKGLEYPCVIMPRGAFNFKPSIKQNEWRWIRPSAAIKKRELLPPFIPVETSQALSETVHSDIRDKYVEEFALDELNKMYVGFTRPVDELYVYMPLGKSDPDSKGGEAVKRIFTEESTEIENNLLRERVELEEIPDEGLIIKYGMPLTTAEIETERKKEEQKKLPEKKEETWMKIYNVNSNRGVLRFEESNRVLRTPVHTGGENEELDPRAEGTLKHRIMQMVEVPSDLDKALLEMKVAGMISKEQLRKWGDELRDAIDSAREYGWFAESNKVINERAILEQKKELPRPDRIIVTPEGEAVVIDYKFGMPDVKHKRQVAKYSDLLVKSGRFSKVSAYLWYIPINKFERVI